MKIIIEDYYGRDYSISGLPNDMSKVELDQTFARLEQMLGFDVSPAEMWGASPEEDFTDEGSY